MNVNVQIVRPLPGHLRRLWSDAYQVGLDYDVPPIIARYLIAEGFAVEKHADVRLFRTFINEHREGKKVRPS